MKPGFRRIPAQSRYVMALYVRLPAILAHLDAVGVVNEPVEDAVGQRGIAYLFVPARYRQLRGKDRGAHLVAVLADLREVANPIPGICSRGSLQFRYFACAPWLCSRHP